MTQIVKIGREAKEVRPNDVIVGRGKVLRVSVLRQFVEILTSDDQITRHPMEESLTLEEMG